MFQNIWWPQKFYFFFLLFKFQQLITKKKRKTQTMSIKIMFLQLFAKKRRR